MDSKDGLNGNANLGFFKIRLKHVAMLVPGEEQETQEGSKSPVPQAGRVAGFKIMDTTGNSLEITNAKIDYTVYSSC